VRQGDGPTDDDPSDLTPVLVAKLRAGDPRAGALLDTLYRDAMIRFCWGHLGGMVEAEDAVQEIFLKVFQSAQVPESFRPWLYKIARNHCVSILRVRGRRPDDGVMPPASQVDAELTGNLTRLAKQEDKMEFARRFAALPEAQREALRLRHVEGLKRHEVAHILDVPESVVKSRCYEGLKALRNRIEPPEPKKS
jgi:RNA polymerase sigma-70 factor (ECF subfamily)